MSTSVTRPPSLAQHDSVSVLTKKDSISILVTNTGDKEVQEEANDRDSCATKLKYNMQKIFDFVCKTSLAFTASVATWDLYFHTDSSPDVLHIPPDVEFAAKVLGALGSVGIVASYLKKRCYIEEHYSH